ncbi:MAG: Uncharacterized protein FD129_685 [bacterium]|nr:MAG: Uncharacterized protein FD129_685 [bacterium]
MNRPADGSAAGGEPKPEDLDLLETIALAVVSRRMTVPAILFLESTKPLSFLGSQFLYFLEPIVRSLIKGDQYRRVAVLLEDRANVERLLLAIEAREAESGDRERLAKQARKQRAREDKARRSTRGERKP